MTNKKHYKSTMCRIREISDIASEHYEEGNQSKCYHAIWHRYIYPRYGICYRTFLNYIDTPIPKEPETKQLTLFDL